MKDRVLERMDQLGCAPELRRLVEVLPGSTTVVVNPGRAEWLPLAGGDGCVAGVYMNVRHLHLLLTPPDAHRVSDETGCVIVKENGETAYLLVTAAEAGGPHEAALTGALDRALLRSATRRGPDEVREPGHLPGRRPQRTCPTTFELVPASGVCELHGATC